MLQRCPGVGELEQDKEGGRDDHVDGRSGQSHPQFLQRFVRHPFQPRQTTNGQQRDVPCLDAVSRRHERVAEFVQHDARKQREDEAHAFQRLCHAGARRPVTQDNKSDENQERRIHIHADTAKLTDFPGPFHAISLLFVLDRVCQTVPGTFEFVERDHVLAGNDL